MTSGAGLRRFVRPQAGPAEPAGDPVPADGAVPFESGNPAAALEEKCEMCATVIPAEHGHIADMETSSLLCACRPCYLLFTHGTHSDARGGIRGVVPPGRRSRYRAVPDRYLTDPGRVMSAADWDQLEIPVGLAFFLRSSGRDGQLTGFYPSPAGATECVLNLQRWEQLVAGFPLLGEPSEDVEAALISRSDDGVEYFLVPVDACYELAGRMRLHWRGFDGGAEARQSISDFLAMVRSRARTYQEA